MIFPDFFFNLKKKYIAYPSSITDPNKRKKEAEHKVVVKDLHNPVPKLNYFEKKKSGGKKLPRSEKKLKSQSPLQQNKGSLLDFVKKQDRDQ